MENNKAVIEVKDETQHLNRAGEMIASADSLVVSNDIEQETAAQLGRDLKTYLNEANAFFAPEIKQADILHKSLCTKRNRVVDPIEAAILRLGAKLGVYQENVRRKKAEEEEKARAAAAAAEQKEKDRLLNLAAKADGEGKTEAAEAILDRAESVYIPPKPIAPLYKPQGTALLFTVNVIIRDENKIPREFLIVDEAKLKRRFKESKYSLIVPGVEFVKKPQSSFRG